MQATGTVPDQPVVAPTGRGARRRQLMIAYLFILPGTALFLLWSLYPLLTAFRMSFYEWNLIKDSVFIGLDNYQRALRDPGFRAALKFTVLYTLVITPILFVLGLGMAFLVRRKVRAAGVFQSIYFMPVCIGLAAGSFLWLYLGQDQIGPLFDLLRRVEPPAVGLELRGVEEHRPPGRGWTVTRHGRSLPCVARWRGASRVREPGDLLVTPRSM